MRLAKLAAPTLGSRLARAAFAGLLLATLSACGLGRTPEQEASAIRDPVVAARVNGRPIYIEDVRSHAVQRGYLEEGEDLDANSDAFFLALDELIQIRLFSMEAEARGLDREPDVRRRLDSARERVLAAAVYENVDERATDPEAIERLYRENASRLGQGEEIHLRHIQFVTREEADAAKRRLDGGERFEALAFELSTDRGTAADGGDLGFRSVGDLSAQVREAVQSANVGSTLGPIQIGETWHLLRIEDLRTQGAPSLEELRPRIIEWLRFQEISELQERLERDARIERLRDQGAPADVGAETDAPADRPDAPELTPAPRRPGQPDAPPFPFPMGVGGVTGGGENAAPEPPVGAPPSASTPEGAQPQPQQPAEAAPAAGGAATP